MAQRKTKGQFPLPNDTLPELEDAASVADFLRTTKKAVYSMVERGQLPQPIRIGRRLLFVRSDLVRWLEERRAASLGGNKR